MRDFTAIDNCALRDKALSLKARGLLVTMAGLPPDWRFSVAGLAAICKEGRGAVASALAELEALGYLQRRLLHKGPGSQSEYRLCQRPAARAAEWQRRRQQAEGGQAANNAAQGRQAPGAPAANEGPCPAAEQAKSNTKNQEPSGESGPCGGAQEGALLKTAGAEPVLQAGRGEGVENIPQTVENPGAQKRPPGKRQAKKGAGCTKQKAKRQRENKQSSLCTAVQAERARATVKRNVCYDYLREKYRPQYHELDELVELVVEVLCSGRESMHIAGEHRETALVKRRFERIDNDHFANILNRLQKLDYVPRNMRQFLLAALYNEPATEYNLVAAQMQRADLKRGMEE